MGALIGKILMNPNDEMTFIQLYEYYEDRKKRGKIEREEFDEMARDFLVSINKRFGINNLNKDLKEEKVKDILMNLSKKVREEMQGKKFDLKHLSNQIFDGENIQLSYKELKSKFIEMYLIECKVKKIDVPIGFPFIHLKNTFDPEDQKKLLEKIKKASGGDIQLKTSDFEKICSIQSFPGDLESEKIELKSEIKKIGEKITKKLDHFRNAFPNFNCGSIEAIIFNEDSFLEGKCDYTRGYQIILSIGKKKNI